MSNRIVNGATVGISPKTVLAFVFPVIAALAAAVINWLSTGSWDFTETLLAVGGVITSAVAALGAYVGSPGTVQE